MNKTLLIVAHLLALVPTLSAAAAAHKAEFYSNLAK
jgi:hypothetical protein